MLPIRDPLRVPSCPIFAEAGTALAQLKPSFRSAWTLRHPLDIQHHISQVRSDAMLRHQGGVGLAAEARRKLLLRAPNRESSGVVTHQGHRHLTVMGDVTWRASLNFLGGILGGILGVWLGFS